VADRAQRGRGRLRRTGWSHDEWKLPNRMLDTKLARVNAK
jgi:hypothetical protein